MHNLSLNLSFTLTMGYAPNDLVGRLALWEKLRSLSSSVLGAWLITGDFNNVLFEGERTRGLPASYNEMSPFQECLDSYGLVDMLSRGRFYTWSNSTIQSKIDRALINGKWMRLFPVVKAYFLA